MTTQVVVGNGHGIAVASDSAVTMSQRRTFDTSEKIYPLPRPHAVAILHAGSVSFHGMPYSTIVNSWIQTLEDVQLRYIADYSQNFRKFLVDEISGWCSADCQFRGFSNAMGEEFHRIWNLQFRDKVVVPPEEAMSIWTFEVERLRKMESYGATRERIQELFEKVWSKQSNGDDGICQLVEYWFDDTPRSAEIDELIKEYLWLSIRSHYPMSEKNFAILTFVGYGVKSMVPSDIRLELYGALDNSIVWDEGDISWATHIGHGFILRDFIGQDSAIATFLQGYNSDLLSNVQDALSSAFGDLTKNEVAELKDGISSESSKNDTARSETDQIEETVRSTFEGIADRKNLDALWNTLAGMPLITLAATAKSLVDLQRLDLDIQGRLPTVGGPVRVGIITKSHGFTWADLEN